MSSTPETPVRVRIVTWNVLFGEMGTAREIGEALRPLGPDIVGFCEVPGGTWTAEVGEVLGLEHWALSEISSAMHKDKYKSILSRTPLRHPREIQPHGYGWWPCTLMGADTTIEGVDVAIYSLHVPGGAHKEAHADDQPGEASRSGYIGREVVPFERCRELVMMGDFNDRIDEANMNALEAAGMRAFWRDAGIDTTDKFSFSSGGRGETHSGVIDHIVFRTGTGTRAVDGGIVELDPPQSDHKPVWTVLEMAAG